MAGRLVTVRADGHCRSAIGFLPQHVILAGLSQLQSHRVNGVSNNRPSRPFHAARLKRVSPDSEISGKGRSRGASLS